VECWFVPASDQLLMMDWEREIMVVDWQLLESSETAKREAAQQPSINAVEIWVCMESVYLKLACSLVTAI
jgi:hypothetical protein